MTVEPLDLTGFKPAALRDQAQPLIQWVEVASLVVDRRYQRSITSKGRAAIQRMADAWDWTKCGAIMCAPAEGGLIAIVDGQHRAHAAALCGIERIPAVVVPMTPQQQAAGFAAINRDRVSISPNQIYRAELAAGAAWAVAARDAVAAAGCDLLTYNPSASLRKPGQIVAVNMIRRMVEAGEAEAVIAGLRAIRESAVGGYPESYTGPGLKAWLGAVASSQLFLRLDLRAAFEGLDFEDETAAARAWARQSGGSSAQYLQDRVVAHLRAQQRQEAA